MKHPRVTTGYVKKIDSEYFAFVRWILGKHIEWREQNFSKNRIVIWD